MRDPLRLIAPFLVLCLLMFGSCVEKPTTEPEKLPYFDLKGFVKNEVEKLDSSSVTLISRIQGKEIRKVAQLNKEEWLEEFDTFIRADINQPALYQSYDTQVKSNVLIHSLYPDANEKLKEMKVTYVDDQVTSITLKMSEENLFYSSVTFANLYMNNLTQTIDHYSIETTQKIWFLKASNIKIMGAIKS